MIEYKNKFKIGDIIEGTEEAKSCYGITTKKNGFLGEVVRVLSDSAIHVETLETKDGKHIGKKYTVESKHFEYSLKSSDINYLIQRLDHEKEVLKESIDEAMEAFKKNTSNITERLVLLSKEEKVEVEPEPKVIKVVKKTNNEIRKEVIAKAIKFVDDNKRVERVLKTYTLDVSFVENEEKRTVVAIGRGYETGKVRHKAIAKCDPNDVFNVHIGRAIALGRLMNRNVSEFTEVVQPTKAIGQIVEYEGFTFEITDKESVIIDYTLGYAELGSIASDESKIISDTNAEY